jgi:hypothetical protein
VWAWGGKCFWPRLGGLTVSRRFWWVGVYAMLGGGVMFCGYGGGDEGAGLSVLRGSWR